MSTSSRVSIPNNVRRMIQDIKEIAGKHSEDDIYAMLKDCNMDPNETAQKLLYIDTFHEVKKKRDRKNVNMSSRSEEYRWTAGMNRRSSRGGRGGYSAPLNGVTNRTQKNYRPSMPVSRKTENDATTHPSNSSTVAANGPVNVAGESSSHGSVPKRSAVDTVKHELDSQNIAAEINATRVGVNKSTTAQDVAKTSPAPSVVVNSTSRTSSINSQEVEEREMSSLASDNASKAISPKPVTQSPQQPSDTSKVVATETSTLSFGNSQSLLKNDSVSKEVTDLDTKVEKLNISSHQAVIFPHHLQVPEAYKSQLTFGSLDSIYNPKDSSTITESVQVNTEAPKEPSLSNDIVSSATQNDNLSDNKQAPPHVPENNLKPLEENTVSLGPTSHWVPPCIVPPLIGSHLVQLERPELHSRDISPDPGASGKSPVPTTSSSAPSGTQPATVAQSSIAVSPHIFPFFQQPYPPNYFPYNPYFPHMFFSQNAHHQFLGHNGFPQQTSTANVYMPPPAPTTATPGGKLPVPSQYKLGTNAANLTTHLGIPSGYATYGGGSAIGYSPNAPAVIPGSSASTEDLEASDLKEKSNHLTTQQGEDSRVWSSATGREIPNLNPNYYYNLPHGQHVAFSPGQAGHGSFAGLYHPSQTTISPPAVRSLIHQSHATAGPVDTVVPPPGPYQQPRIAQMNWNSTLLNRENM